MPARRRVCVRVKSCVFVRQLPCAEAATLRKTERIPDDTVSFDNAPAQISHVTLDGIEGVCAAFRVERSHLRHPEWPVGARDPVVSVVHIVAYLGACKMLTAATSTSPPPAVVNWYNRPPAVVNW